MYEKPIPLMRKPAPIATYVVEVQDTQILA